jgi:hypothetical protein
MDAFEKVRFYIGLVDNDSKIPQKFKKNLSKYGLGTIRTLKDYYDFAGIDLSSRTVKKNFCRKDNKATQKDIESSNEKNSKKNKDKKENKDKKDDDNYNYFDRKNSYTIYFIFLVILITIIIFMLYIKK